MTRSNLGLAGARLGRKRARDERAPEEEREEDRADEVREPRRARVLERSLAEPRLQELEVREARQAEAATERESDGVGHALHFGKYYRGRSARAAHPRG
jgi:hypothetical protein